MTHPLRLSLVLSISALALAACSGEAPPPTIRYDSAAFTPAVAETEPAKPVRIVKLPEPLPLPGQLKPSPSMRKKPEATSPTARVDAANKAALEEPTAHGYINAIQVFPFSEGALYHLYTAPEEVSDLALQPGENLVAISAGDTVRWVIGNTTSGSGPNKQVHILIKPFAAGLKTNLVITTDRRSYHLDLDSTDQTYMAAVSWTYSEDQLFALKQQNETAAAAAPIDTGVSLQNLRFRYAITGDNPPWRPVRVFDDGAKVYIEFPERIDQGEAPPLFVVGVHGGSELVNYRVRGNYYIVDQLFAAAELRLGENPQQVVRIDRTDAVRTSDASNGRGFGSPEYPR
ncbi:MAG TPA: P-type conjugative transfer protein TrbG [Stellaceae bacterium]|nr:P-type conjugative transfer protein TrbG [Stellaceae bacterium]